MFTIPKVEKRSQEWRAIYSQTKIVQLNAADARLQKELLAIPKVDKLVHAVGPAIKWLKEV